MRGEEDEVDEDYIFKFMDNFICKPLENEIEDIIQFQSNLQEIHLPSQRKLSDLKLKMDNANVNNEAQLHQLKGEIMELKTHNQEFQKQLF
uniref:Uncharacterized protein n=1 Tax=Cucumis melo TaxID=3656 RepID=A0A9I9E7V8_CUCME